MRAIIDDIKGAVTWLKPSRILEAERTILRTIRNDVLIATNSGNAEELRASLAGLDSRSLIFCESIVATAVIAYGHGEPDYELLQMDLVDVIEQEDFEELLGIRRRPASSGIDSHADFNRTFGKLLPFVRTWHLVDPFAWQSLSNEGSGIRNLLTWLCDAQVNHVIIYSQVAHGKSKGIELSDANLILAKLILGGITAERSSTIEFRILRDGQLHDRPVRLDFDRGSQYATLGKGADNFAKNHSAQALSNEPTAGFKFEADMKLFQNRSEFAIVTS